MHLLALIFILGETDAPPPEFFAPNEEVRAYIHEAVGGATNHPALEELSATYEADVARVPQVTALEDPMLSVGYFARSSGGEGRYSVMLSQTVPWFGTLKTRGKKAEAEAEVTLSAYQLARLERIAEIKKAYAEYAFLAERTRIAMDQVDVLTALEDVARSRYALGIGGQEDLLRIEMEEAKLQASYDCCALEKNALGGKLNEALGREAAQNPPDPQPLELPPPPPPAPVVLARIHVANPALSGMDAAISGKENEVILAQKTGWPNFTLSISYTDMKDVRNEPEAGAVLEALDSSMRLATPQIPPVPVIPQGGTVVERVISTSAAASAARRQGIEASLQGAMDLNSFVELENMFDNEKMKDEVMVSVGVNLPIWRSKVKAGIREAEHRVKATEHQKRKTAIELEAAAKLAIYGIEDGYRRLRLYDDKLLPKVKQTYETLEGAYESGSTDAGFLDVLSTVQTMLEFEEQRAEAFRDIQVAAAELEFIMGGPWTAAESAPVATPTDPADSPEPEETNKD